VQHSIALKLTFSSFLVKHRVCFGNGENGRRQQQLSNWRSERTTSTSQKTSFIATDQEERGLLRNNRRQSTTPRKKRTFTSTSAEKACYV